MKDKHFRIIEILSEAKKLAVEYKNLTGKPLGITGEVAEFEAARLLGLQLMDAREAGYDAVEKVNGKIRSLQIKGRSYPAGSKKSQRLGRIDIKKDWDALMVVVMDENLETVEIFEALRNLVEEYIKNSTSGANKRGALTVGKVKSLGYRRWPK